MTQLKDKFFWESYGKFSAAILLGSALGYFTLNVSGDTAATLAAGAIITFPVAFSLGKSNNPENIHKPRI